MTANARDVIARGVNSWLDKMARSSAIRGGMVRLQHLSIHPDGADAIIAALDAAGFVVAKRDDIEYHIEALTLALDKNDEGHIYGAGGDVCDYLKAIIDEREES